MVAGPRTVGPSGYTVESCCRYARSRAGRLLVQFGTRRAISFSMMRKKWLIGIGVFVGLAMVVLVIAAFAAQRRFEPYIRQQTILYLKNRFDSDVEIQTIRVSLPNVSALRLLLTHERGAIATVEGEGVVMRHRGRRDVPPMFVMKSVRFDVELGTLFINPKIIQNVVIDGLEINIPPKGQRPQFDTAKDEGNGGTNVIVEGVMITNSRLTILPRDPAKLPLQFDLHEAVLESAGKGVAMKYRAALTNAKPPGEILSNGTFGPWAREEPGDTPLTGEYDFDKADLGVFRVISGILHSRGTFEGTLSAVDVDGEASVPNFRLKQSGNAVPLTTRFQVRVDGTNGNTILKPVNGTLGTTAFTTSGTVIKRESAGGETSLRNISLTVTMPQGSLRDVLKLAMKGEPFMEGLLMLKTKIDIPPLSGTVRDKLLLDGSFEITSGRFLKSTVQDQIDSLSRRSQGQPGNEEIDEVVSQMAGKFKLEDGVISFSPVSFSVPGSGVDLTGSYDLNKDVLDFQGTLKMMAKVSQTMTGWKHWALKPVDSFFSKEGAGTLLKIKVQGSATAPKFGLNRGK